MTTDPPVPGNVRLRYGLAKLFEGPDVRTPELRDLTQDDAFSVLGTEGDFYHVQLADGTSGFVFSHNLLGSNMPLTTLEQQAAGRRAAALASSQSGWRGTLKRWLGR